MALTHLTPTNWFSRTGSPVTSTGLVSRPASSLANVDPFFRMTELMDRLFDSVFDTSAGWAVSADAVSAPVFMPKLDIAETEKAYKLSVELPGVELSDIQLTTQDDALIIRAERKQVKEEDGVRYHRIERRAGRFERMLTLPADADVENISAEFKNGVLEINVPRRQDVEALGGRRIEIKSA
ncbi:MAG: small heat shock protein sHSP20 [Wenzhouxiangellaceae bacterium]